MCVSFLVTKLTRDYKSQTNDYWKRLHSVFILSWFSEFGITHLFAGTNKMHASQLAFFPRLYCGARLTCDVHQESSIILNGATPGKLARRSERNLLMPVQSQDSQEVVLQIIPLK